MFHSFGALTLSLVLSLAASAQTGSVQRSIVIKPGVNGFVGPLAADQFGSALAALGDVDGNGVTDLAVGAPFDVDGGQRLGAVWILFLRADGTVQAEQKINQSQGGFTGLLTSDGNFGRQLAPVGDLDGDGIPDLAVLSRIPNRLWVLFLNRDGTVKGQAENLYTDPVFAPATLPDHFAFGGLAALGDVTGDGLCDIAVGAPRDPDGAFRAGAVWILALGASGKVQSARKISQTTGGFTGPLADGSELGAALHFLGDLDGDGTRELLVHSPGNQYLGQMWVLSLDAALTVVAERVYDYDEYSLVWPLSSGAYTVGGVSRVYAPLGDLDGDGVTDLALGFPLDSIPGSPGNGAVAVAFLNEDGSVHRRLRIGADRGGLGSLPSGSGFGTALASLGDLDGDGAPELAVGAPTDQANGIPGGAVYLLSLAPDAVRNGSGINPVNLSQASEPAFDSSWSATLDCSGHGPGMALVFGYSAALPGTPTVAGELLVGGQRSFLLRAPHTGGPAVLSALVPPISIALIDRPIHVQGLCTGVPGLRLSNALDVLLGY